MHFFCIVFCILSTSTFYRVLVSTEGALLLDSLLYTVQLQLLFTDLFFHTFNFSEIISRCETTNPRGTQPSTLGRPLAFALVSFAAGSWNEPSGQLWRCVYEHFWLKLICFWCGGGGDFSGLCMIVLWIKLDHKHDTHDTLFLHVCVCVCVCVRERERERERECYVGSDFGKCLDICEMSFKVCICLW